MRATLEMLCVVLSACLHDDDLKSVDNNCEQLKEIRRIPFSDWDDGDAAYESLIAQGRAALPCLVEYLDDASLTPDPRPSMAFPGGIAVGDVALFVIGDIVQRSEASFLPEEIQTQYLSTGVYAYFEYVSEPRNRAALKERVRRELGL